MSNRLPEASTAANLKMSVQTYGSQHHTQATAVCRGCRTAVVRYGHVRIALEYNILVD